MTETLPKVSSYANMKRPRRAKVLAISGAGIYMVLVAMAKFVPLRSLGDGSAIAQTNESQVETADLLIRLILLRNNYT